MNTRTNLIVACAGLLFAVAFNTPVVADTPLGVNLLSNPGFEDGPGSVTSNFTPITSFPSPTTGQWGAESSFVEGTDPNWGQSPHSGSYMLAMNGPGTSSYTQAWQTTAITGDVGDTVNIGGWFAAPQAGSIAVLEAFCYDSNGDLLGSTIGNGLGLSNSNTWEELNYTGTVQPNTAYIITQVAYDNASLVDGGNSPYAGGFVDDASLTITTPEPSTLALLGVGAIGLLGCAWRRRKLAK